MSPSLSRTKRADVLGFIKVSTSLTKSSLIPAALIEPMTVPSHPSAAPIVAPVRGTPRTGPRGSRRRYSRERRGDGERLSVDRERSVRVPHHDRQIREDEEVLVHPRLVIWSRT
jgi:hypothetical protein